MSCSSCPSASKANHHTRPPSRLTEVPHAAFDPRLRETIAIQAIDNGVGIAAENLDRIFAHGFTTRVEGHGFGLHSSTLAATDPGGKLTVSSDGDNQGATFELALPAIVEVLADR